MVFVVVNMYDSGDGVLVDMKKVVEWYLWVVWVGYECVMVYVVYVYGMGCGLECNEVIVLKWFDGVNEGC